MTLQITKDEFDRLEAHRIFCKSTISRKIADSVEDEIVKLINDGVSPSEIMRTVHVSQGTVTRVRRQNKLWGV
jgi:DNA invertase Pin-like site-specific DNA recombinase